MSNAPNSQYDWGVYLPKMVRRYEEGWSIPDICKEIQDEAAGFTPSQRMVYNKFKSEGYPTNKIKRDKFLKELNLSRCPGLNTIGGNPGNHQMVPATPPFRTKEVYDDASHLSTSGAIAAAAHQPSTEGVGVPTNSGDLHGSDVPDEAGHSDSFGPSTESNFSHVSNGLDLDGMDYSDLLSLWTAELPQRQTSFDGQPSFDEQPCISLEMETDCSAQISQGSIGESHSFDTQGWSNNDTSSGYDGSQHIPPPWEFEGVDELHEHELPATIKDYNTPQLPLSYGSDIEMREETFGEATLTDHSSSSETQSNSAILPEDHNTSRHASVADRDVHVDEFGDSSNVHPHTPQSRLDKLDTAGSVVPSKNTPSPVTNPSFGSRMISRLRTNQRIIPWYIYNRSGTPEKRDSGYGSGRSSPMTPLVEENRPNPRSLFEFKGLYRVPCQQLHEPGALNSFYSPKTRERFTDTATCSNCLYSAIHNLSWSARQMKLEVFQAELKLEGIYDITALDMTGNSALHYAASGGAGSKHLDALIQAGADPCQVNSAGQLFLHCLRPYIKETNSEDFDGDLVTAFNADLINFLNSFQHTGAFRWRDNDGRTVLDALASKITDEEIRAETFRIVKNLYPLEVSRQFPMTRSTKGRSNNPGLTNEPDFATTQERQEKAWKILGHASAEPSYVDPETGDNVLHALARLKLPEKGSLLSQIQEYVLKDIDLNLHNRDRDCPLAAFISERPFLGKENDETGATMSKYLDALLWKDARRRIPNRINVNMRNREGATALYYAAIRARPDSVRSLIEAGANVNACLVDGHKISILQATINAKAQAVHEKNELKIYQFDNVISYLEHENAVAEPSLLEERAVRENSVRIMPL